MGRPKKQQTSSLIEFDSEQSLNEESENSYDPFDSRDSEYEPEPESYVEPEIKKAKVKRAPVKREKSTTTKGHYITNAVLFPEVIRAKALGVITNELAKMLMMIAERYSCKSNFIGYSFRKDMVSFALVNLMANALKFNPEKSSNPFSFYTTSIHNSFLQYLAYEKDHRDLRDALIVEEGLNPSSTYTENSREDNNDSDY